MSTARDQIIETTCDLLEVQGYHATGINQIIRESGAPKGSLYYYFPDGKEGLTAEAIERTGKSVADRIKANLANETDAGTAIRRFVLRIADAVEASGYRSGGPLMTVAMETATSSERLNLVCREAYKRLRAAFEEKLIEWGLAPDRANELATFIVALIEGGIVLSRTNHSGAPLRQIADELGRYLRTVSPE